MTGPHTFFGSTTQKLTPGREKGVRGLQEAWEDDSTFIWPEVTRLFWFWDGSCRHNVCGAGMLIKIFTQTSGVVHTLQKVWTSSGARIPATLRSLDVLC